MPLKHGSGESNLIGATVEVVPIFFADPKNCMVRHGKNHSVLVDVV